MTADLPARPRYSVIIRAYNEAEHFGCLLSGITRQTLWQAKTSTGEPNVEIILVDSGSTDATTAIAAAYPVTICHIKPGEFTFGRSLNLGITQARGELIVITSAHIYTPARSPGNCARPSTTLATCIARRI